MPERPAVLALPDEVRAELESRLAQSGFSGYAGLSEWLNEKGFEISKSALHRYGQQLERKMAAIKASTQAAKAIADAAPDDEDSRSAAVISLVQTGLFDAMVALREAEDAPPGDQLRLLSRAATAVADVSRASISQKKWLREVRAKAVAAAESVVSRVRQSGLSEDTAEEIRSKILGIV